jgi:hypothetical protein
LRRPVDGGIPVAHRQWTEDVEGRQRILVGLLADEGVPSRIAKALARELPPILHDRVSGEVAWDVDHRSESLSLNEQGGIPLIDVADKRRGLGWDIAILLTDLPRRAGTQPIVSDYSVDLHIGLLSMPAVGAWQVRRRTRALVNGIPVRAQRVITPA